MPGSYTWRPLKAQLETLAEECWGLLQDVRSLGLRYGEESVTDWLMLRASQQFRAGTGKLEVFPVDHRVESITGVDWLWLIPGRHQRWIAVQAKRLNLTTERYDSLSQKVGKSSRFQLDVLDSFASRHSFEPIYCLFNSLGRPVDSGEWHCTEPHNAVQLGVSAAPLSVIKNAVRTRGGRTFARIHANSRVQPWRCLVVPPQPPSGSGAPPPPTSPPPERGNTELIGRIEAATARLEPGQPVSADVFVGLEPEEVPRYVVRSQ